MIRWSPPYLAAPCRAAGGATPARGQLGAPTPAHAQGPSTAGARHTWPLCSKGSPPYVAALPRSWSPPYLDLSDPVLLAVARCVADKGQPLNHTVAMRIPVIPARFNGTG